MMFIIKLVILLGLLRHSVGSEELIRSKLDMDDNVMNSPDEWHRSKRSLTTICVQIQPSGPQEEPYYMCKGANFPTFHKGSNGYGSSPQYSGSSEPPSYQPTVTPSYTESDNHGSAYFPTPASNFQAPATKLYDTKSQSIPTLDSSSYSKNGQQTPASKYGGFRPSSSPYNSQQADSTQKQQQQSTFQQAFQPSKGIFPTYETPTSHYDQSPTQHQPTADNYEPIYADDKPSQSPSSKSPFGFGSSSAAPTTFNKSPSSFHGSAYETQSYGGSKSGQSSGAHSSATAYNNQQPKPNAHGSGSYAQSSFAATHPVAGNEKSPQTQNVPYTHAATAPAAPLQNPSRPSQAFGASSYVAPTVGESIPAYLMPPAASYGSGEYYSGGSGYQVPNSYQQAAATPSYSSQPNKYPNQKSAKPPTDRYRTMIDEEVLGIPDWGFTPEEFDLLRSMPSNDPILNSAMQEPVFQPFQRPRTVPLDHLDDPVMQKFYASLQPPTLASTFRNAFATTNPLLGAKFPPLLPGLGAPLQRTAAPNVGASYAAPQQQAAMRPLAASYAPPQSKQSPPSTYSQAPTKPADCPVYAPPPPRPCSPYPSYTSSPPVSSQHFIADSEYGASYQPPAGPHNDCNSCGHREYSFQPVFIALPCYGQQSYGVGSGNYNNGPAPAPTPAYENVAMGNPIENLFGRPQLFGNRGLGSIFPGTKSIFPTLGLANPAGSILGSSQGFYPNFQATPQFPGSPIIGTPYPFNYPSAYVIQPQAANLPESRMASATEKATTTHTPLSTTTENPKNKDSNESPESIEEKPNESSGSEETNDENGDTSDGPRATTMQSTKFPLEEKESVTTSTTARPSVKNGKRLYHPVVASPTQSIDEEPKNLEEESQKTFKAMMHAAKTFSNISKTEGTISGATTMPPDDSIDRLEKRHNFKAATGNSAYRRKYLQKL